MAEAISSQMAGQDSTPPPSFDPSQYQDLTSIYTAAADLTHNDSGEQADGWNQPAQRWLYQEDKMQAAIEKLGEVNEAFQKEYSKLKGEFSGEAGDAFQELASKIYSESEDVYNTLSTQDYSGNIGGIGEAIKSFSQTWWATVKSAQAVEKSLKVIYTGLFAKSAESVGEVQQMVQAENEAEHKVESKLLHDLQTLFGALRDRFQQLGNNLSPLHVEPPLGQAPQTTDGSAPPGQQQGPGQYGPGAQGVIGPVLTGVSAHLSKGQPVSASNGAPENTGNSGSTPGSVALGGPLASNSGSTPGSVALGGPLASDSGQAGGNAPGSLDSTNPNDLAGNDSTGQQQQAEQQQAEQQQAQQQQQQQQQQQEQQRQQGLADAQNAANQAISGLQNPGGLGDTGSPGSTPGSVGQRGPLASDSGQAGGNAPGALDSTNPNGQAGDPTGQQPAQQQQQEQQRQQGLADAQNAANQAIAGLQNPSGLAGLGDTPGSPAGQPSPARQKALDSAKGAADKAIDELKKPGDAQDRTKALDDAKKAADKAIQGLQSVDPNELGGLTGDTPATMSPGPGQSPTPGEAGKTPATMSSDPGLAGGQSPDTQQALQDAKNAANQAIAGLQDPGGLGDTNGLGEHSPSNLSGHTGQAGSPADDGTQQALQDARNAANDAIKGLQDPSGLGDPGGHGGQDGSLSHSPDAQQAAGSPHSPGHAGAQSPDTQEALQDAKNAANQAIDSLKDPSSLSDFLGGQDQGHGGGDGHQPIDPEASKAAHDAESAVDKAIENLPGYNGNDAYAKALHEAKEAADKAIENIPEFGGANGPGATPGLGHGPVDTSSPGPDLGSLGHGGGGGLGGGGGIGDIGGHGGGGEAAALAGAQPGGPVHDARLDTDVAQNEGLTRPTEAGQLRPAAPGEPAVPAGQPAGGGMPMMPPGGMGGMGGMGQQQKREREPNTWLQADGGAWSDQREDEEPPSVLGRA